MLNLEQSRPAEFSEEAQEEAAEATLRTLSERERAELAQIERALIKLENRTYGLCEACGSKISAARLKALPAAQFCLACEENGEKGERSPAA